jgi:arginine exporter protein ArgO
MTQNTFRPVAFLASAALVSMLWFQTIAIPQAPLQPTTTISAAS